MKCDHDTSRVGNDRYRACIDLVPIFAKLDETDKQAITDAAVSVQYKKGEMLYAPGDYLSGLIIVHQGRVKVYRMSPAGKEQIVRVLTPGDFTGSYALFGKQTEQSFAEALVDTEVCMVRSEDMKRLVAASPSMALNMLQAFSSNLEQAETLVEQLALYDVGQRVAQVILKLWNEKRARDRDPSGPLGDEAIGQEVTLPLSKGDLAALIGTTPESLSRKLTSFQSLGWIDMIGQRRIKVLDPDRLTALLDESPS